MGKIGDGGAVLGRHVADGGPVLGGHGRHPRTEDLDELADHALAARSSSVTVSSRSVAVAPSGNRPFSFSPTTRGMSIGMGWPNMAASASMPPTPHPTTPMPLTVGVWLSVPTTVSGKAMPSRGMTTWERYSRLTWWQMPVLGGTTEKLRNACLPHLRNS